MKVVIENEGERVYYEGPLQYKAITRALSDQEQIDFFNLLINKGNGMQICKIINQQSLENALNQNVAEEITISLKEIIQQINIEEDEQEEQQKLEQQQQKINKQSQQVQQLNACQQKKQQKLDKQPKKAKKQTPKQKRQADIKKTFNKMAKLMQNHIDKLVKKKIKAMIPSIKQQIIMQLQQKKQQQKQLQQIEQQDRKDFISGQLAQNIIKSEQTKNIQYQTQQAEQIQQKVENPTQQQIKVQQASQSIEKKIPKPDNKAQFYNEFQKLIKLIYQEQRQQQQEQITQKKAKRQEKIAETVKKYLQREKQKNQARQNQKIEQRCLKLSKIYNTNSSFFRKYVQSTLQLPLKQMIEHYALTQESSIPQLQQKMAMKRQQKYKKLCQYFNKFKPQYQEVVEKYPNLSINQLIEILCQNGVQTYVQQIHGLIKNEELTNKSSINKKIVKQLGKQDSWVQLQCSINEKQGQDK